MMNEEGRAFELKGKGNESKGTHSVSGGSRRDWRTSASGRTKGEAYKASFFLFLFLKTGIYPLCFSS